MATTTDTPMDIQASDDLVLNHNGTLGTVVAGDLVRLHFGLTEVEENNRFQYFSGIDGKYEEGTKFKSLREVKEAYGVKTMKELDALDGGEYGMEVYAVFEDGRGNKWAAYIYEGRWAYGSGAHRLGVSGIWESKHVAYERAAEKEAKENRRRWRTRVKEVEDSIAVLQQELKTLKEQVK